MMPFEHLSGKAIGVLMAIGAALFASGCGVHPLGASWIGRSGLYDYSPSVIQTGNMRQFWWCGQAVNPSDTSQDTDAILYESVNLTTGAIQGPWTVLSETPGAWDSAYTCNPRVVSGSFANPLGDGQTYEYAMYYVGTSDPGGDSNDIGVAFSKDGSHWKKYPQPVIQTMYLAGYGVGQPAVYNSDQKAGISMFYEDNNSTVHHVVASSTDGVHFTVKGTLTTAGLDPDDASPSWGDMAYDPETKYWYAVFNRTNRAASTTGGVQEFGQLGVELYKIPASALLTGTTPWQQLTTIDTNLTGYESNFIAGFVRDSYGNINVGSYPTIQMYVTVSDPQPSWNASPAAAADSAMPSNWDITVEEWIPNSPLLPFYRYFNGSVHEVTTGWVDPSGGFKKDSMLGQLYQSPQQGANVPFYGCKAGSTDYFVSLDSACEGARILGKNGYAYSSPVNGLNLIALYRCRSTYDHFVSQDSNCEGQTTEELLGYVLPSPSVKN
jgi:hypothetical protein